MVFYDECVCNYLDANSTIFAASLLSRPAVGLATVWGYVWWMCYNQHGPRLTLAQLRSLKDTSSGRFSNGFTADSLRESKVSIESLRLALEEYKGEALG
jgi:hypothetical protein